MASVVDICNLALSHLGDRATLVLFAMVTLLPGDEIRALFGLILTVLTAITVVFASA